MVWYAISYVARSPNFFVEPVKMELSLDTVLEEAKTFSDLLRAPNMHRDLIQKLFKRPKTIRGLTIDAARERLASEQPCGSSYEVTNVGIVRTEDRPEDEWRYGSDASFSQSTGYVDAQLRPDRCSPLQEIFDFSVVTVRDHCRLTLSYLESRIDPEDAQAVAQRLVAWLKRIADAT